MSLCCSCETGSYQPASASDQPLGATLRMRMCKSALARDPVGHSPGSAVCASVMHCPRGVGFTQITDYFLPRGALHLASCCLHQIEGSMCWIDHDSFGLARRCSYVAIRVFVLFCLEHSVYSQVKDGDIPRVASDEAVRSCCSKCSDVATAHSLVSRRALERTSKRVMPRDT